MIVVDILPVPSSFGKTAMLCCICTAICCLTCYCAIARFRSRRGSTKSGSDCGHHSICIDDGADGEKGSIGRCIYGDEMGKKQPAEEESIDGESADERSSDGRSSDQKSLGVKFTNGGPSGIETSSQDSYDEEPFYERSSDGGLANYDFLLESDPME